MGNLYKSEVLIFTEELPENVVNEIDDYINVETEELFKIEKGIILQEEKEKFPEATMKFSVIGDCANWNESFRYIIRLLRKYTVCVLIV